MISVKNACHIFYLQNVVFDIFFTLLKLLYFFHRQNKKNMIYKKPVKNLSNFIEYSKYTQIFLTYTVYKLF